MDKGYEHPKIREKRAEVTLGGPYAHGLPRLVQANEAWIASRNTAEIELETAEGQRVIIPLAPPAIADLHKLCGQLLSMGKTDPM